jgi:hypothetical protein
MGCVRGSLWSICVLASAFSQLSANTLLLSGGSGAPRRGEGFSLGTQFVVTSPYIPVVTALGIFDLGGAFANDHEIGLWDDTLGGTMIGDATVTAASTNASTPAGFLFASLPSPVALVHGHTYTLAAYYAGSLSPDAGDFLRDPGGNPGMDPNFGSFVGKFSPSNTIGHLSEPTGSFGDAYVGANMQFTVPEPGTFLAGFVSMCLLALCKAGQRGTDRG